MNDISENAMARLSTQKLVAYFEQLKVGDVATMGEYYAEDSYFCDPFNEVHCLADIQKIFLDMFAKLDAPHFKITQQIIDANSAVLVWDFQFTAKFFRTRSLTIHGVSQLRFDAQGKVVYHRDYWDSSAELYAKLPLVGGLFRGLRRLFSSKPHV